MTIKDESKELLLTALDGTEQWCVSRGMDPLDVQGTRIKLIKDEIGKAIIIDPEDVGSNFKIAVEEDLLPSASNGVSVEKMLTREQLDASISAVFKDGCTVEDLIKCRKFFDICLTAILFGER